MGPAFPEGPGPATHAARAARTSRRSWSPHSTTKILFDMMKGVEQKAGTAAPPEPAKLTAPDREVVELLVARLRRQIAVEAAEAAAAGAADPPG
jgi:hypothetical protein